jgi:S-formylglutathione hydrolase FrmB
MNIGVILPDQLPHAPLDTIWLLHGLGENGTCWPTRTTIENLALNYQVAIIMPNVDRSFYMDEINGLPYWTYFTKELMPEMQHLLSSFTINNIKAKSCHSYKFHLVF